MATDHWTGRPLDRGSDNMPSRAKERCEEHGCYLIDRCLRCGAPVCCPMCCEEAEKEAR